MNSKFKFFKFFIFFTFLWNVIKSQILDLPLGREEKHIADFEKFFRLDLTESQNHKNLIFHVGPTDMYENWSDPDIYISKVKISHKFSP